MKKIFISFLTLIFLFPSFSSIKVVQAGNDTYPVELAVPD